MRDDGYLRVGAWNSVLIHVWLGTSTAAVMREVCQQELEFAKRQPDKKYALVSVVRLPSISDFSADTRKALEARLATVDPYLLASITLLPSHSLASSIVRGIITGLALAAPSKVPAKVVATPDDAVAWLAPRLPRSNRLTANELLSVLEQTIRR
jgi:hypothetical protein